jgi:hypothetical protein
MYHFKQHSTSYNYIENLKEFLKECKVAMKLLEVIEAKLQEPISLDYLTDIDDSPI